MPKKQRNNIDLVFNNELVMKTLAETYKQKDYNKLSFKLRNYQHLILSLQAPPLTDVEKLQQIDNSMSLSSQILKEIDFNSDQMIEDLLSVGYRHQSEIVDHLTEVINLMHEYLINNVRQSLQNLNNDNYKNQKKNAQLCSLCHEIQEASNLKKLKTSFGLQYPEDDLEDTISNRSKQEISKRQTDQFLQQINILLSKKDKLMNLQINSNKLASLVSSLSKLTDFGQQMLKRNERRKKTRIQDLNARMEQESQGLQNQHNNIVEELRKILKSKLNEGYSYRFKDLLDKFQKAIKDDKTFRVEKKTFINISQAQVQTIFTPEAVELKIVKDQLAQKIQEIQGIKQGRKQMEERFMKTLQNQRKIIKQLSSNAQKGQHINNTIQSKAKQIMYLQESLEKMRTGIEAANFDEITISLNRYASIHGKTGDPKSDRIERITHKSNRSNRNLESLRMVQIGVQASSRQSSESDLQQTKLQNTSSFRQEHHRKKVVKKYEAQGLKTPNITKSQGKVMFQNIRPTEENNLQFSSNIIQITISSKQIKNEEELFEDNVKQKQNNDNQAAKSSSRKGSTKIRLKKSKDIIASKKSKNKEVSINKKQDRNDQLQRISSGYQQQFQDHVNQKSVNPNISYMTSRRQSNRFQSQVSIANLAEASRRNSNIIKLNKSNFLKQLKDVRLTESTPRSKYLLNSPKIDESEKQTDLKNYTVVKNKQNVIRINKFERRTSNRQDKQKVKQIVQLLKNQTKVSNFKPRKSQCFQKIQYNQASLSPESYSPDKLQTQNHLQFHRKQPEFIQQQNIVEAIKEAKTIIQAEYTYLKATGFIKYLYSINKKLTAADRSAVKYQFEFTHISEKDVELFGGCEEMIRYSKKMGKWKELYNEQEQLKINNKNTNFVSKICKYMKLLHKMNQQYYEQYILFLAHPLEYCQRHFEEDVKNKIKSIIESTQHLLIIDKQQQRRNSEIQLNELMMRLINYHNRYHDNCSHIAQFLEKIGYYRYAL